jgi:hypothetical protein
MGQVLKTNMIKCACKNDDMMYNLCQQESRPFYLKSLARKISINTVIKKPINTRIKKHNKFLDPAYLGYTF